MNQVTHHGERPGGDLPLRAAVRPDLLAFDRVEIKYRDHSEVLTPQAFLEMPLDERIDLSMQRRLRFLLRDKEVGSREALRSLMHAAARE